MKIKNPVAFANYADWLTRNMVGGVPLASYSCPHCAATLHTAIPCLNTEADSLSTCPVCSKVFFKSVSNYGNYPVVIPSIDPVIA